MLKYKENYKNYTRDVYNDWVKMNNNISYRTFLDFIEDEDFTNYILNVDESKLKDYKHFFNRCVDYYEDYIRVCIDDNEEYDDEYFN